MPRAGRDRCLHYVVDYNVSSLMSTARTHKSFFWVHIPKCGSTFEVTLYLWGCPAPATMSQDVMRGDLEGWRAHHSSFVSGTVSHIKKFFTRHPLQESLWCDAKDIRQRSHEPLRRRYLGSAMVMLRDPRQRFVSAFRNQLHCYAVPNRTELNAAVIPLLEKDNSARGQQRALEAFSHWGPGQGCQTKMVGGEDCCAAPHKYSTWPKRLSKAISRIRSREEVLFVGITDLYAPSVCLFHAMHGGKLWDLELHNIHRTTPGMAQKFDLDKLQPGPPTPRTGGARDWDVNGYNISDPYDQQLFDVALEIFNRRLVKYGDVVGPCCVEHGCTDYFQQVVEAALVKSPGAVHVAPDRRSVVPEAVT